MIVLSIWARVEDWPRPNAREAYGRTQLRISRDTIDLSISVLLLYKSNFRQVYQILSVASERSKRHLVKGEIT